MDRDIDKVIDELRRRLPGITSEQLRVAHPGADDDGLWFFAHADRRGEEVQLESATGNLPFLVEGNDSDARDVAHSIEETVALVIRRLGLRARHTG